MTLPSRGAGAGVDLPGEPLTPTDITPQRRRSEHTDAQNLLLSTLGEGRGAARKYSSQNVDAPEMMAEARAQLDYVPQLDAVGPDGARTPRSVEAGQSDNSVAGGDNRPLTRRIGTAISSAASAAVEDVVEFWADWFGVLRFYHVDRAKALAHTLARGDDIPDWKDRLWANFRPHESRSVSELRSAQPVCDIRLTLDTLGSISDDNFVECIASFPGRQKQAWETLQETTPTPSSACVWLPDVQSGLGQHVKNPESASGKCYCNTIYGKRDYVTFGYLRYVKKKHSKAQRLLVYQHAEATGAVVVDEFAGAAELAAKKAEARQRWEESGKVASWGCAWFHQWKYNIGKAVEERHQHLVVVYAPGQRGTGKVKWKDLASSNLWDGIGLGASQKVEVAYLDRMIKENGSEYKYKDVDSSIFLDGSYGARAATGATLSGTFTAHFGTSLEGFFPKNGTRTLAAKSKSTLSNLKSPVGSNIFGASGSAMGSGTFPTLAMPSGLNFGGSREAWSGDQHQLATVDKEKAPSEGKNSDGEWDDVDSLYSDFSDLEDMVISPMRWPKYILLQLLVVWIFWSIYKIKDGTFVAGLESACPGETALRLTDTQKTASDGGCEDYRFQFWRYLSYQFSHAGVSHIGMNSFMLVFLGLPLEGFHGSFRLLLMFNFGVVGGGLCHVLSDPHGPALVGMSGGCYSLLGMHMADIVMNWDEKARPRKKLFLLIVVIIIDFLNVALSSNSDATASPSHWAHLGGWIFGLLIGIVLGKNVVQREYEKWIVMGAVLVGAAFTTFALSWSLSWPPRDLSEQVPWCWSRQVMSWTTWGDFEYHCVRCGDDPSCIAQWSYPAQEHEAAVSTSACENGAGWAVTG